MPEAIRVLIVRGKSTLKDIREADIVLAAKPNGSPDVPKYEVVKNKWSDRLGEVDGNDVEAFLDACGVRSAT